MVRTSAPTLFPWTLLVVLPLWLPGVAVRAQGIVPLPPDIVSRAVDRTAPIAVVGDQTILAGEVLPLIDLMLSEAKQQATPEQLEHLDLQRALTVQQLLPRKVEVKLVLLDFYRTIPSDKLDEVLGNIKKQVEKQFFEEQLPLLQKQYKVEFFRDLDQTLRAFGTSIEQEKAAFQEQMVARTLIGQKINRETEITHEQLLDYYHEHIKDYEIQARARWEKLTALFEKFPDKAAADQAIVDMGNQVLRGANFAAVAKKHSQGTNAWDGGRHDWTTQGALISKVLDNALFTLPLNQLSPKLEDERGFHIVRVIEREDARCISFEEAQEEIRKKLREEERERQIREYLDSLRDKTYVWTLFDDVPPPAN